MNPIEFSPRYYYPEVKIMTWGFEMAEVKQPGLRPNLVVARDKHFPEQRVIGSPTETMIALRAFDLLCKMKRDTEYRRMDVIFSTRRAFDNPNKPRLIPYQDGLPFSEDLLEITGIAENLKKSKTAKKWPVMPTNDLGLLCGIYPDIDHPLFLAYDPMQSICLPPHYGVPPEHIGFAIMNFLGLLVHDWQHHLQFRRGHPYYSHWSEAQANTESGLILYNLLLQNMVLPLDEPLVVDVLRRIEAKVESNLRGISHLDPKYVRDTTMALPRIEPFKFL